MFVGWLVGWLLVRWLVGLVVVCCFLLFLFVFLFLLLPLPLLLLPLLPLPLPLRLLLLLLLLLLVVAVVVVVVLVCVCACVVHYPRVCAVWSSHKIHIRQLHTAELPFNNFMHRSWQHRNQLRCSCHFDAAFLELGVFSSKPLSEKRN